MTPNLRPTLQRSMTVGHQALSGAYEAAKQNSVAAGEQRRVDRPSGYYDADVHASVMSEMSSSQYQDW
jgi:hypothetical protein